MPQQTTLSDLTERPHATVFADEPRTVRLALDEDEAVAAHSHPGRTVLIYVLEGRLRVALDGDPHEVPAGDILRCDGDREIAPTALDRTTALVVLAPRPEA